MDIKEDQKILISLPDYYYLSELNFKVIELNKMHPEYFYEGFVIDSVYGSAPCIWNGGRLLTGSADINRVEYIVNRINEYGVSVRHTFTNKYIDSSGCLDAVGNKLLQVTKGQGDIKNGVNVGSAVFDQYVRVNYPEFYILYSTTLHVKDIEEINTKYSNDLLVCDYRLNNNFDALKQIKHPENVEMLVGEVCVDDCPYRGKHHSILARNQILMSTEQFRCPYGCEYNYDFYNTIPNRKHLITPEMMIKEYGEIGINKFKLSGRTDHIINFIERYIYFLIQPEYKDEIRNKLLLQIMSN